MLQCSGGRLKINKWLIQSVKTDDYTLAQSGMGYNN